MKTRRIPNLLSTGPLFASTPDSVSAALRCTRFFAQGPKLCKAGSRSQLGRGIAPWDFLLSCHNCGCDGSSAMFSELLSRVLHTSSRAANPLCSDPCKLEHGRRLARIQQLGSGGSTLVALGGRTPRACSASQALCVCRGRTHQCARRQIGPTIRLKGPLPA